MGRETDREVQGLMVRQVCGDQGWEDSVGRAGQGGGQAALQPLPDSRLLPSALPHTPISAVIEWPGTRFLDQTLGGMNEPEVFQGRSWSIYIGAEPLRLPAAEVRVGIRCQLGI